MIASRWALQRDAEAAPVRVLTINNDITYRRQVDAERFLLTERLALATAVARVGVWDWDLLSDSLTWDATLFDIYGLPRLVPMPYKAWLSAVHHADLADAEAALRRIIEQKDQGTVEYRIIRSDGAVRNISSVARAVLDARDNVSRLIGVAMDVTDRKDSEQALEQSRQDQIRFKDEFLSHVSHELRSPLTAIKQFTAILLAETAGELNQEQRKYQQIVLKNIQQLQSMIDDLLEITRLETGQLNVELECVCVADAVTDAVNTLQETARLKGVALSCDQPRDQAPVQADQIRLRQILIILLDNAIKFSSSGGVVRVHTKLSPHDPAFMVLEVSDTGCGIGPEMSERIFDRLYQVSDPIHTSRKGLGLGLYICRQLVMRLGGQISVTSELHKGSTFRLTLPVFSLKSLLAPLLKNDEWPTESVAVIAVEIGLLDVCRTREAQEEWYYEARSLLQRCLLPDLDVLLPTRRPGIKGRCFYIAAFANEQGVAVLVNRIREQFARHGHLRQASATLATSYSMLHAIPREDGASMNTVVASMAARLEQTVKSQTLSEASSNE